QIEHHLFPQIPRSRLKSAYPVVKEYCRERGIAYYETSSWQSYWEIFQHLKRVSQAARGAQLTDASLAFAKPSAIDQRS
ncbi:MAG: fatty acid desaturase, partial [Dehalococcoidia bacterium]